MCTDTSAGHVHVADSAPRHEPEAELRDPIALAPVDAVTLTTLVDNVSDLLLADRKPRGLIEPGHVRRPCSTRTEEVRIVSGTEVVARHPRCWSKEEISFDPGHYLALLERKPGALDHARPLEGWDLPECFGHLRRRLEAEFGWAGTREYIRCCASWSGQRSASSPVPSRKRWLSGRPDRTPSL